MCVGSLKKKTPELENFKFLTFSESAQRVPSAQVQKQQRLAKVVGRFHQLLPVLLQVAPRQLSSGEFAFARLHYIPAE